MMNPRTNLRTIEASDVQRNHLIRSQRFERAQKFDRLHVCMDMGLGMAIDSVSLIFCLRE
jgi:hypothetical protein